jgi:hypothetical protein
MLQMGQSCSARWLSLHSWNNQNPVMVPAYGVDVAVLPHTLSP